MAKVLLVEDDNNLREIYQARLMAEGYDIVSAQNGEEALVIAKQNKPDLVISDVMMPRISGFEMLDILRNTEELKATKVIMLTALGQADDQERANGLGADKYLVKSQVTLEDIVNAAKELLGADGISAVPPAPVSSDPMATPSTGATPEAPVTPTMTSTTPVAAPPVAPVSTPPAASALPEPPAPPVAPAAASQTPPVTAPATPVAAPAPTPEPVSTPTPIAAPQPVVASTPAPVATPANVEAAAPVTAVPEPAVSPSISAAPAADAAAQSIADEEAALQAQIESYSKEPAETPLAVEPTPADTTAEPAAPAEEESTPEEAAESNEETITDAVDELNAPSVEAPIQPPSVVNASKAESENTTAPIASFSPTEPAPAPDANEEPAPGPTVAPAPAEDDPNGPTGQVNIAGKKVIRPINDLSQQKPNLEALLAKEDAASAAAPAAPVIGGVTPTAGAAPVTPVPPATPGQSFDPNSVAL